MDILFTPPNIGALPSSAMAEVEIKTEALKTTSLQRMLDLEKKYKMERLQSPPTSPPMSPAPPVDSQDRPPLQIRRADSHSRQQNHFKPKAAQRSSAFPPLSITIPEPAQNTTPNSTSRGIGRGQESAEDTETETTVEPLHKQVKFLAPDSEDDDMSDQSSICQSPSWEGYGQRKKEKKKEAERKKREKEQADKEAKAAKKRLAVRLSKSPPPSTLGRNPDHLGLGNPERSMSDPILSRPHMSLESQLAPRPLDVERASSTNDLQHSRLQKPADTEPSPDTRPDTRPFVGGVKLERERGAKVQNTLQIMYPPSLPYQLIQTSGPEPVMGGQVSPSLPAGKQDSRSPRDSVFPPSASRTPMLRHMPGSSHSRSNSFLQGASKFLRGQDGKHHGDDSEASTTSELPEEALNNDQGRERGRDRGQVRNQRSQSTSRAMDNTMELQSNGHSSSTRSSSRTTQHTRRSSITQEAKSMAMKLTGKKTTPSAKDESAGIGPRGGSQVDYFNFMGDSFNTSVLSAMAGGTMPTRPTTRGSSRHTPQSEHLDLASTLGTKGQKQETHVVQDSTTSSQSSRSKQPSASSSVTSSQGKKTRSLRDAAKAALHISKGSGTPSSTSKPAAAPPYLAFRTRMQSQASSPAERKIEPPQPEQLPASVLPPKPAVISQEQSADARTVEQPSASNSEKTTELDTQTGSRVSEGSSTSSAYEDTSPLPSPTTTPDTSRPQSSKDLPLDIDDLSGVKGSLTVQDDERTLRQSSDGSRSSNTSITPRLEGSQERKSLEMGDEDRWSRTALPLEIDCDAQSFTTSFSNLDNQDGEEDELVHPSKKETNSERKDATQSHTEIRNALKKAMSHPKLAKSLSDPFLRHGGPDNINHGTLPAIESTISIPPKSKRRDKPYGSPDEISRDQLTVESQGRRTPVESQRSQGAQQDEAPKRQAMADDEVTNGHRSIAEVTGENTIVDSQEDARRTEPSLKRDSKRERVKRQRPDKAPRSHPYDERVEYELHRGRRDSEEAGQYRSSTSTSTPGSSLKRSSTSSSLASSSSTRPSLKSPRQGTFAPISDSPTDLVDPLESIKSKSSPAGSRVSTPDLPTVPSRASLKPPPGPPRVASAPTPTTDSSMSAILPVAPLGPSSSRPPGPVSILKQPTRSTSDPSQAGAGQPSSRSHTLSALPKHMQLQAGISVRPPATTPENRMAPIAKMFVECCNCKFYHDMPSKLYECMAKPDAVVEDKLLGISGAITTMVKCPWCAHNMSTSCCAGYAAVVYLKEKLH